MIKSLFSVWLKDKQLYILLGFIAVISVLMLFVEENTPAIAAMLTFIGGTSVVSDAFSGGKSQLLFSVSPAGRAGYIAGKFIWAAVMTLLVLVFTMIMSFVSASIHGVNIDVSIVMYPLVAAMLSMLVNCVAIPCVCLFRREAATIISFVIILGSMIVATVTISSLAENEALFASIYEFISGLNALESCLLTVCGLLFCAAMQLLSWTCTKKAHSH